MRPGSLSRSFALGSAGSHADAHGERAHIDWAIGTDFNHRPPCGHWLGHLVVPQLLDRPLSGEVTGCSSACAQGVPPRRGLLVAAANTSTMLPGRWVKVAQGAAAVPDALQHGTARLRGHREERGDAGSAHDARGTDVWPDLAHDSGFALPALR